MATLTTSFIPDIVDSLFAKLTTDIGTGTLVYPGNTYLHVKTIARAGGYAALNVAEVDAPALWIEYIAGGDDVGQIGRAHGTMFEGFNLYLYAVFTPEILEMPDRNLANFRKYCEVAMDALMRRTMKSISDWGGGVSDVVLGSITNGAHSTVWAYVLSALGDYKVEGRVLLRVEVNVE